MQSLRRALEESEERERAGEEERKVLERVLAEEQERREGGRALGREISILARERERLMEYLENN